MEQPLTPQKRQPSLKTEGVQESNTCLTHTMVGLQLCAKAVKKQADAVRDDDAGAVASPASPGGASSFTTDNSERETPVFHDDQGSTAPTDCSFSWSTPGKAPCYSPTGARYSNELQQPQPQQQQDLSAKLETSGKTSSLYCTLQVWLPPILLKYIQSEKMDANALASIRGFWGSLSTSRLMLRELIITCLCFALAIMRLVISLLPKDNIYACWVLNRTERLMPSGSDSKTSFSALQWPLRLGPISVSPNGIEVKNDLRQRLQTFFVPVRRGFWLRVMMTIETLTALARDMLIPSSLQQTLGPRLLNLKQQSAQHIQKLSLPFEGLLTVFHVADAPDSSEADKSRGTFLQRLKTLLEASLKQARALKISSAPALSPSMSSVAWLKEIRATAYVQIIVTLFLQWVTAAWDAAVHLKDSFALYMAELIATCGESDAAVDGSTWLKSLWGIRAAGQDSWIFGCGTRRYASKIIEDSQLKND